MAFCRPGFLIDFWMAGTWENIAYYCTRHARFLTLASSSEISHGALGVLIDGCIDQERHEIDKIEDATTLSTVDLLISICV